MSLTFLGLLIIVVIVLLVDLNKKLKKHLRPKQAIEGGTVLYRKQPSQ